MSEERDDIYGRVPVWFLIVCIITAVATLRWPVLAMGQTVTELDTLSWLFPAVGVVGMYLAYRSYWERRYLAWILVAVIWLCVAGIEMIAK